MLASIQIQTSAKHGMTSNISCSRTNTSHIACYLLWFYAVEVHNNVNIYLSVRWFNKKHFQFRRLLSSRTWCSIFLQIDHFQYFRRVCCLHILKREAANSSSLLSQVITHLLIEQTNWRQIQEDSSLYSYHHEKLKIHF